MSESPSVIPFVPQDDPVLSLPSRKKGTAKDGVRSAMEEAIQDHPEKFREWLIERQKAIDLRAHDPLRHGYEPDIWHTVDDLLCRGVTVRLVDPRGVPRDIMGGSEVLILGGNRSGKTEFAARTLVRMQVRKPKTRTWSFHTTGKTSIAIQQPRFWAYLPPEWKSASGKLKQGMTTSITYTQKRGFTDETYVLPNGSQHWFMNYAQDIDTIEGEELDAAATDELVPLQVIDTLRFRLTTRKGVLIMCFTPIEGYSPTVKALLQGAETVFAVRAKQLPLMDSEGRQCGWEEVPRIRQAQDPNLKIVNFHVETDNPFGNADEVIDKARPRGRDEILCRVYGEPTKTMDARFVRFKREIHVIDDEAVPAYGSNYHFVDPCSGRNWAMIWVRVLSNGDHVIYREWPCESIYIEGVGYPGPWAEPDGIKFDGKRGPAQSPFGFGLERYREEILRMEGWKRTGKMVDLNGGMVVELKEDRETEAIHQRSMDSRFGAAPTLARGETTTLIDSMGELEIYFEQTPGEHQDEGIEYVNKLLDYDIREPVGPMNRPKLYIARSCTNTIFGLQEWTGQDGKHGACKDFVDLLRYMALSDLQYVDDELLTIKGGGSYGGGLNLEKK